MPFSIRHFPPSDQLEVAIAGRSNAGKSSLINRLCNNKSVARTSGAPGRTRRAMFLELRGGGRLIDLPGYGFARMSKGEAKQAALYLRSVVEGRMLAGGILIMDARREYAEEEEQLLGIWRAKGTPCLVVANKADKLSRQAGNKRLQALQAAVPETSVVLCSAGTGAGVSQVLEQIRVWLRHQPAPASGEG